MFLIVRSPSPHSPIIHDERADKAIDVFRLTTFFVKGNTTRWRCQRVKSSIYVLLRATGDTDEQIGVLRLHEVLDKAQNPLTSGWGPDVIWTFVQRINNDIGGELSWEIEHAAKTLRESGFAWLF